MLRIIFCLIISLWAAFAQANIVITGTRIIYPSTQKTVNVQMTNVGNQPSLVQAWIDNGDPSALPEQVKTPFVLTPPISRVEGNKGQTLRITYTGEPLPQDRESVFYLNVLDIPPKPNADSGVENYLQIAIRSRLKLFFRPTTLNLSLDDAFSKVTWQIKSQAGKTLLIANNPTPYFITYNYIEVHQNGRKIPIKENGMVAPFSEYAFELASSIKNYGTVHWTVINDYGSRPTGESSLQ